MKGLVLMVAMIVNSTVQASCIRSDEPCNDMIFIETEKTSTKDNSDSKKQVAKDPASDFHWSDEKDPEERGWVKENWD